MAEGGGEAEVAETGGAGKAKEHLGADGREGGKQAGLKGGGAGECAGAAVRTDGWAGAAGGGRGAKAGASSSVATLLLHNEAAPKKNMRAAHTTIGTG